MLESQLKELQAEAASLQGQSEQLVAERTAAEAKLRENVAVFRDGQGIERSIALIDIIRVYHPNAMGFFRKAGHYLAKVWELLSTPPRESNTEGGVLPALFGTVTLDPADGPVQLPLGRAGGRLSRANTPRTACWSASCGSA